MNTEGNFALRCVNIFSPKDLQLQTAGPLTLLHSRCLQREVLEGIIAELKEVFKSCRKYIIFLSVNQLLVSFSDVIFFKGRADFISPLFLIPSYFNLQAFNDAPQFLGGGCLVLFGVNSPGQQELVLLVTCQFHLLIFHPGIEHICGCRQSGIESSSLFCYSI